MDSSAGSKGNGGDVLRKDRSCTDIFCIVLYILSWLVFFVVTFYGAPDADIRRLYYPRDYKGAFCGADAGLENADYLIQMMNLTTTVEGVAKQLVCSSAAQAVLTGSNGLLSTAEQNEYLCACCIMPCASCSGSLGHADLTSPASLQSTVSSRMGELTTFTDPNIFSPASANSASMSPEGIWSQLTSYFVPVCVTGSCALPNSTDGLTRSYTYSAPSDVAWQRAWATLSSHSSVPQAIRDTVNTAFTFQALPRSRCPYDARYCIPFPGVEFVELGNFGVDYCIPRPTSEVQDLIGGSAASSLQGLGKTAMASVEGGSIATEMGEFMRTMDAIAVVAFFSFIIGLIFMVFLRFFAGCMVWCSILSIFWVLAFLGLVSYIRSYQCADAGLLETGQTNTVAVAMVAVSSATGTLGDESLSGIGADYRGFQTRTRFGNSCQRWDSQDPHVHSWTPQNYNASGLVDNYCRNPATVPPNSASTIWCLTTDPDTRWQECLPLGIVQPECLNGYAVEEEDSRTVLEYCAYITWGFAGLWLLVVICLWKRIRLAIAIQKVACMFIYHTPHVLLVPLVQVLVSIMWFILWGLCISLLIATVPPDYVPTDSYWSTWAAADEACTDKWPEGFAYRYEGDLTSADDPCSGNMGVVPNDVTPRCWSCAAPRYTIDVRAFISLFHFFWTSNLLIAIGQCVIAGTVAAWFFTSNGRKGLTGSLGKALKIVFRYHIGSLAFGAFILAVVQTIRAIMKYFEKQAQAQGNKLAAIILKLVQCCLWCFENCVKFLNTNAYIQIAINGTNFCTSAKEAFALIFRNLFRIGVLAVLGKYMRYVGVAFIVVSTASLGYFVLQLMHPNASPVVPVICYAIIGYVSAKLFMNMFSMAVDTSLQCFIKVEEDKMDDKDDFIPGPLKDLVAKSATKKQDDEHPGEAIGGPQEGGGRQVAPEPGAPEAPEAQEPPEKQEVPEANEVPAEA